MLESQFIDVSLPIYRLAPENAAGACGRYVERLCVDPTLDGICFERRLSIQSVNNQITQHDGRTAGTVDFVRVMDFMHERIEMFEFIQEREDGLDGAAKQGNPEDRKSVV